VTPLYPFGFGLSYTTFSIANVRLSKSRMDLKGKVEALADVANTGRCAGSEVVQMYIRDLVSSVTRPVKELKGFRRVELAPGESTTVKFEIAADLLKFWDVNMKYVVEPGEFSIMIGNSSRDTDLQKVTLTVTQ
jgi:beta-glucosidase